jgi:hypothetical protein
MNILEQEDIIKGLPDQALMKEASAPSGQVPQFLVVSEIKRRSDMRKRYQEQQQQPQGTVKDQIVMEAMGIGGVMPPQMAPQQPPMAPAGAPPMGGMPPMAPPMPQAGIASAPQGMPPMGMAQGGTVKMQTGGITSMPGSGALYGIQKQYIDPLLDRAQILARTAGISIEEAYQALVRQAQMNMPDYGMLGPAGMGELPSLAGLDKAVGEKLQDAYGAIPKYSMTDPLGGVKSAAESVESFVDSFPYQSALQRPNYSALLGPTEARRSGRAPVPMDEEQMRTAEAQLDALDGMPVTPEDRSFKGITLSETRPKPQVKPASEIYADSSLKRGIEALGGAISDELSATPLAQFDREASQRIREVMEKDGIGAAIGQFGREAVASVMPAARTVVEGGIAPILGAVGEGVAYIADTPIISEPARALDQLITGSVDDPLTLGQIFGSKDATKQGRSPVQTQGNGMLPEYTDYTTLLPAVAADEVAAQSPYSLEYLQRQNAIAAAREAARNSTSVFDRETTDGGAGTATTKGERTPATRATDAVTALPRNDKSAPDMPALDFSDLIAESKQQALANAMIQLGAGVASGDVAKGLSAAGTAAMQGTSDARALDMKRRLAEYQAGREDIRRGDEADRFERQMSLQERKLEVSEEQFASTLDQADRKIRAEIEKGERVNMGQLFSFVSALVKESMPDLAPEGKTMRDVVNSMTMELLQKYGPLMDVDVSGLAAPSGTQTGSRSREDILAQYNVAN